MSSPATAIPEGAAEEEEARSMTRQATTAAPSPRGKMRKKFCLQLVTPTLTLLVVLVYGLVSVTKETLNNEAFTSTVAEKLQDRILQAIGMNGGGGRNSNCSCITTPAGGNDGRNLTAAATAGEDADAACSRGNNREQLSSFILEYGLNRPHQTLLLTHMESNFVSIFWQFAPFNLVAEFPNPEVFSTASCFLKNCNKDELIVVME